MDLDRSSPMPLWAQLESELQRRLDAGDFATRFPTDHELVDEYGVSRHTVREAIRHLNRAGVLIRERGRGTVVNQSVVEQSLGTLYSLFDTIEAAGHEQRSEVLDFESRVDAAAAHQLGLADDAELIYLERLRFVDDEPLAIDRAWLPAEIGTPLLDTDFSHTALYAEIERHTDIRPNSGWERLSPIVPPPDERQQLGMGRGEAAFFIERSTSADERLIEWRTTTLRGKGYRFVATFSAGASPAITASMAR